MSRTKKIQLHDFRPSTIKGPDTLWELRFGIKSPKRDAWADLTIGDNMSPTFAWPETADHWLKDCTVATVDEVTDLYNQFLKKNPMYHEYEVLTLWERIENFLVKFFKLEENGESKSTA